MQNLISDRSILQIRGHGGPTVTKVIKGYSEVGCTIKDFIRKCWFKLHFF